MQRQNNSKTLVLFLFFFPHGFPNKAMDINTKILNSLEKLRMNNMQRTSAIAVAAVLSECVFTSITVRVWLSFILVKSVGHRTVPD